MAKLTGNMEKTPVIGVNRKVGGYFKGTLVSTQAREVKLRKGKGYVYEFLANDTDFPVEMKNDKTQKYDEVDIEPGQKVSMFASTVLHRALSNAQANGKEITITYLGKEAGPNGDYHNYDVEQAD
jgi:hypothetical protein